MTVTAPKTFVSNVSLNWPAFTPAALHSGTRAVFALPLQVGAIRLGVLDLYWTRSGPLSPHEVADALVFADTAGMLLLDGPHRLIAMRGRRRGAATGPRWIDIDLGHQVATIGEQLRDHLHRQRAELEAAGQAGYDTGRATAGTSGTAQANRRGSSFRPLSHRPAGPQGVSSRREGRSWMNSPLLWSAA
jgi:hypothetical protein